MLAIGTAPAVGQPAAPDLILEALLAAGGDRLWVADTGPQRSVIYRRAVNEPYRPCPPLSAQIACMASAGDRLAVFLDTGQHFSLVGYEWIRATDLPNRAVPVDVVGEPGVVYALIESPPPGVLPTLVAGDRPATSQPFDAGQSPYSVVRHDSLGWAAVVPCDVPAPAGGVASLPPQLGLINGTLFLLNWQPASGQILGRRLNASNGRWTSARAIAEVPSATGFWLTTLGGVPALVVASEEQGSAALRVLRGLGGGEGAGFTWREAKLRLSDLPAGNSGLRYLHASEFNQHIVALARSATGGVFLRFGRIESAPVEPTVALSDIVEGKTGPATGPVWLQAVTMSVLFGLLLILMFFRRRAMTEDAALPRGAALALAFQRLGGLLIDLGPLTLLLAWVYGVEWQAAMRELVGWAFGADAAAGRFPSPPALWWWGTTIGVYTLYSLIMELALGRTLGKIVVGTRLYGEDGQPPRVWQVIVRNLFRIVELAPPLWVLGFLVVLSRNRQRIGDIFARTVVIRRVTVLPTMPTQKPDETEESTGAARRPGADENDGATPDDTECDDERRDDDGDSQAPDTVDHTGDDSRRG